MQTVLLCRKKTQLLITFKRSAKLAKYLGGRSKVKVNVCSYEEKKKKR